MTRQRKKTDRSRLEADFAYSVFTAEEMRAFSESRETDHQRKSECSSDRKDKDLNNVPNGDVLGENPTRILRNDAKKQKSDLHTEGTSALCLRKSGNASMSDLKLTNISSEKRDNMRVNGTKTHLSDHSSIRSGVKPSEATAVNYKHKACAGIHGKSTKSELKNQTSVRDELTRHGNSSFPSVNRRSRSWCTGNGSVERHSSADFCQKSGSLKKNYVQPQHVFTADSSNRLKASQAGTQRGRATSHTNGKKTPWRS